ncbi:hypothetical protein IV203_022042 [Nitzschia inconspicua]|uniref:Uncharacterized protein n=1 Tax=Nitzschia inconspicua TaxID=303405 RepID=A0A9K3KJ86_9STRA|nr:hypothetical protein IV203_022042 [Nitzschia inconspicua]
MKLLKLFLVAAPAAISSLTTSNLSPTKQHRHMIKRARSMLESSAPGNNEEHKDGNDGLVLDGLDKEMGKMASKFAFTESDFLAAARRRAEEKVKSKNASAGDNDWKSLAEEKKSEYGEIDDWDNSIKEAGNQDSKILMFTDPQVDGDDDGEDDAEQKLLLF